MWRALMLTCLLLAWHSETGVGEGGVAVRDIYLDKIMQKYGTGDTLSLHQLSILIDSGDDDLTMKEQEHELCQNEPNNPICQNTECLTAEQIFELYSLPPDGSVNVSQLHQMSPAILYQLQNHDCHNNGMEDHEHKASSLEVWGYGFLCVTLINLCALMGLVFLPLMKKDFYSRLLMYMVALAVGTLAGSSVLFLIPEAFGLTTSEHPLSEGYVWKSATVLGGIYMFFLVERLLKIVLDCRLGRHNRESAEEAEKLEDVHVASVKTHTFHKEESMNMSFESPPPGASIHDSQSNHHLMTTTPDVTIQTSNQGKRTKKTIKPVAWMVIFGDGLHNFIDGLSIGAAFSENLLAGASVSVAVFCEELPHELGDFAILLNSGMTMRKALCYNFLSACMCYLGLVFGIMVGELTEGGYWIFAIAGGMFLYISLVDMLPEVNHAAEEEEKEHGRIWLPFFLQNAGILTGYGLMILLAYFGGNIDFSSS